MEVENWKNEEDLTHSFNETNEEYKQVPDQIGTYLVDADWLNANPSFQVVQEKKLVGLKHLH